MTKSSSQPGPGQPNQGKAGLGQVDERDGSPNGPMAEDSRFDSLLQRYKTFLRGQRGLAENTVRIYLTD
ncbi:MAG: hypothetical protein ACE1Y2_06645, partial [Stenotrophomonas maltophilia]